MGLQLATGEETNEDILKRFDLNKDGTLDFNEFVAVVKDQTAAKALQDELVAAFMASP